MKALLENKKYQFIILLFIGVFIKYLITLLSFKSVIWLVAPVNFFIEIATGNSAIKTDDGFLYQDFIISFECSAIHFFNICFISLWAILLFRFSFIKSGLIAIIASYCITLFANTNRILLFLSEMSVFINNILQDAQFTHHFIGGIVFCFWLFIASFFTYKITIR